MKDKVDNTARQQAWPADRFHPVFESFTDWLNDEAPDEKDQQHKRRNQPRYRPVRRD